MKPITTIITLAITAMTIQIASAATISGSLGELQGYFSYYDLEDINGRNDTAPDTQTTDWVLYGAPSGYSVEYTTKLETPSFSTLSGAIENQPVNGVFKVKHDAGFGDDSDATTGGDYGFGADKNGTAAEVGFTHTMLGEDETLVIYLSGLASAQESYDFSASITGSVTTPLSWTDTTLPTERVDGVGNRDGEYGILTLQITDAQPGDVLTFSFSTDYSEEGVENTESFWGVGIGAASTTVTTAFIPEPASVVLLGLGMLMLAATRRRK